MIKISLKALVSLMIHKGWTFTVEKEEKSEGFILRFVVGNEYPTGGGMTYLAGSDVEACRDMVMAKKDGQTILLYDMKEDRVLALIAGLFSMIQEAKREAIRQAFKKQDLILVG